MSNNEIIRQIVSEVISKDLGGVTAYAAAVNRGYTGTKEQFETLMASYATVAQQAVDAKEAAETAQWLAEDARDDAVAAKEAAQTANTGAVTAKNAAETAQGKAETAQGKAEDAQEAAESAKDDAVAAKNSVESTASNFASTAAQAVSEVNAAGTNQKNLAQAQAENAQAYAEGKRGSSTVGQSDPAYHNNAKYYSEQAAGGASGAGASALVAEGYAKGTQSGTAVTSDSPYYQDNAAYHKEQAAANASDAEAWANGTRGGDDIESDDPAYGKSAKDYAEEAAASAASLTVDSALSDSSTNPVQNKVVNAAVNSLMEDLTQAETEINTVGGVVAPALTWTSGKYVNNSNGQITGGSASLYITQYIPIPDKAFAVRTNANKLSSAYGIAFYNANKEFISGFSKLSQDDFLSAELVVNAIPNNAVYAIVTQYDSTLTHNDVYVKFDVFSRLKSIEDNQDAYSSVLQSAQFVDLLEGRRTPYISKYISNGAPTSHTNWIMLMTYIPVEEGKTYSFVFDKQFYGFLSVKVAWYTSAKVYISEVSNTNNNGYTAPENAAFARICTTNTNYSQNGHDNFDTLHMMEVPDGYQAVALQNAFYRKDVFPFTSLSGKKWVMFGDSMTEQNVRSFVHYHDYIRSETGIVTVNYGVGGSGYKNRDDNSNCIYQLALKHTDDIDDADIITCFAGINDMWGIPGGSKVIGEYTDTFTEPEDITGATTNTIMACVNKFLDVLEEYAPFARLAIISPIPCYHIESDVLFNFNPNDDTNDMSLFVAEMSKLCKARGIPFLDLYHNSGLRPWDSTVNNAMFKCYSSDSPDGLHPNEIGHKYIYPMIREFIKTLA